MYQRPIDDLVAYAHRLSFIVVALLLVGCGFAEPRYTEYEKPSGSTSTSSTTQTSSTTSTNTTSTSTSTSTNCVSSALAAFNASVEPAIDSVCSSCHSTGTPFAKLPLKASSGQSNRDKLYAYTGTDASKLATFISSAATHGGGDQSANLPLAKIKTWTDSEAQCK